MFYYTVAVPCKVNIQNAQDFITTATISTTTISTTTIITEQTLHPVEEPDGETTAIVVQNDHKKSKDTTSRIQTTDSNAEMNYGGHPKFRPDRTHQAVATTTTTGTKTTSFVTKVVQANSEKITSNIQQSSIIRPQSQLHISPPGRHSLSYHNNQRNEFVTQALSNFDGSTNTLDMLDSSSSALDSNDLLDSLDEIHINLKLTDVILLVCGTLAGTMTLCMMVSFVRCCCKKRRKKSDHSDSEEPNGNNKCNASKGMKQHEQSPDILQVTVETHPDAEKTEQKEKYEQKGFVKSQKLNDKFSSLTRQQKVSSVKDRINALESKPQPDLSKTEDSKPKRKKPKSKAFEDFENLGILIGFGNVPHRRVDGEQDEDAEGEEERDNASQSGSEGQRIPLPYPQLSTDRSLDSDSFRADSDSCNTHNYSFLREDDEGIHTMDSDEDELDQVTRDTEILKSFRKPPPPKNRGRVKRSFKKEGPHPSYSRASRQMANMETSDKSALSDYNTPISQILQKTGDQPSMSPSPLTMQQANFYKPDQNQANSQKSREDLRSNSTNSSPMLQGDPSNEGPDKRIKDTEAASSLRPYSYHNEMHSAETPKESSRVYNLSSSSENIKQSDNSPSLTPGDLRKSQSDHMTLPSSPPRVSIATVTDLTHTKEKETSDLTAMKKRLNHQTMGNNFLDKKLDGFDRTLHQRPVSIVQFTIDKKPTDV